MVWHSETSRQFRVGRDVRLPEDSDQRQSLLGIAANLIYHQSARLSSRCVGRRDAE
jgi:hypothetical protein